MIRLQFLGIRIDIAPVGTIRELRAELSRQPLRRQFKPEAEASEDFWNAFQVGSTLVCTCTCGRTHFCSNTSLDYEDGELTGLLANQKADPKKYIEDSRNDSVAVWDSPSGAVVWGCPCFMAARYENFLVNYRFQVLRFFRNLSERETRDAKAGAEALDFPAAREP